MALALGLQPESVQAAQSPALLEGATAGLALVPQNENHGFATKPMGGKLTTRDAHGQVNIRRQPTVRSPILSPGDNQDPLYIFKSALTPEGERWYFIENIPTGEQGWVHGDYVRLNEPGQRFPSVPMEAMEIDPMTGTVDWDTPHGVEERPEVGILTAQDGGAWVNVRSQPSVSSTVRHTGLPGDSIYIYRAAQFSSPAGRVRINELWYFVAFLESGAEGWVRSDFVESAWESDEPFDAPWPAPKAGALLAAQSGQTIPVYRATSTQTEMLYQGKAGEVVTLLRKLETARGDLDRVWYFVKLAGGLEGWVQGPNVLEGA